MSILIKGMPMPKSCLQCPFRKFWDYEDQCLAKKNLWVKGNEIPPVCPLIELPPHGDLIDRDALNNAFTGMRFNADGLLLHYGDREDWYLKGSEVETLITNATTIIESEGEE